MATLSIQPIMRPRPSPEGPYPVGFPTIHIKSLKPQDKREREGESEKEGKIREKGREDEV